MKSIILIVEIIVLIYLLTIPEPQKVDISAIIQDNNEKITLQKQILHNQKKIKSNFLRDIAAHEEILKIHEDFYLNKPKAKKAVTFARTKERRDYR